MHRYSFFFLILVPLSSPISWSRRVTALLESPTRLAVRHRYQAMQRRLGHMRGRHGSGSWPTTLEDVCICVFVCARVCSCVCVSCIHGCTIIRALQPVSHKAAAAWAHRLEACNTLDAIIEWKDGWMQGWISWPFTMLLNFELYHYKYEHKLLKS